MNPLKVIRQYCLSCSNDQPNEVTNCQCFDCPLYEWRFGKNPTRAKRVMTDEQRAIMAERLKNARTAKNQ
jgi:hypothetical protein